MCEERCAIALRQAVTGRSGWVDAPGQRRLRGAKEVQDGWAEWSRVVASGVRDQIRSKSVVVGANSGVFV